VIGATGLQGNIVSRDLLEKKYRVLLCGRNKSRVDDLLKRHRKALFRYLDLRNSADIIKVLKRSGAKIIINCAEGDYDLKVQEICLKLGVHYLDLGSEVPMTKQQFALHEKFQNKKLCAITGCGSVPGIGNVMLRHAAEKLDKISSVDVGFAWTPNMKKFVVPFSIESIVEEFTEKPDVLKGGVLKKTRPQQDSRLAKFWKIGQQRIFLVRHPEPYTFYRYLKEKGVRSIKFFAGFPEFSYQTIITFIKSGAASKNPVDGKRRIDLLVEDLKANYPPKGYREKENLWLIIKGTKNKKKRTIRMNCIVPTIKGWEKHGCNIDTGLTCSIIAQMLKEGTITSTGSRSPEFFVPMKPFFKELAKRKMAVYENGKRIN
jgi:saccharopine dehydrogenase (NAD+, L-lysine-forming)